MLRVTCLPLLILLLALPLTGCDPEVNRRPDRDSSEERVWPETPDRARLAYLRSIVGPADLGIGKNFLQQLGEFIGGASTIRLIRPMAVVTTSDGIIYIADPGARGVHLFDPRKRRYQLLQRENGQPLPSPVALAATADGIVYVSDSRLAAVYTLAPGAGAAVRLRLDAPLARPVGLAFDDATGQLYLVDCGSHEIKVFSRDGGLISRFGRRGTGAGEFNFPTMIWLSRQGQLLVTDTLNFRVQAFDTKGVFLRQFGDVGDGAGYLAQPKGIAMDGIGHVYVVDSRLHAVQIFDLAGEFLFQLGLRGEAVGEFWLPAGIFIDAADNIFIADAYNGRVQVFQYVGDGTP